MDCWKYLPDEGAVCLTEEFDFQLENDCCKNKLMGCELKPMSSNGETFSLVSNTEGIESLDGFDFLDNMGLNEEIRKSFSISSEPSGDVFSDEIGGDSDSRDLPDFLQSNTQDLAFSDLKLGRLVKDGGVAKNGNFPDDSLAGSSAMSSSPAKRSRPTAVYLQSPSCQVLGCNKDLSFHKGYYKRHRVCDEHTRTSKVIVKGLEQRFCQQCSRFHHLAEFDDDKRSCRRRLAAHNKRRRKPRFSSESGMEMIDFSSSSRHAITEGLPTATTMGSVNLEAWSKWVENIKVEDSIESSDIFLHANGEGERMHQNPSYVKGNIITTTTTASILNSSNVEQASRALSLLSAGSPNMSDQQKTAVTNSPYPPNHYTDSSTTCRDVSQSDSYNAVMDLQQLSSHLRRIEQQRHSTDV